ncbi:hypothetical protein KKF84_01250 [Myxococcota bacterium]|nr:hypothetical protein [Myxococcota bacterium]MBU1533910.1 hypothetical protein [Myxococcota bacterium]
MRYILALLLLVSCKAESKKESGQPAKPQGMKPPVAGDMSSSMGQPSKAIAPVVKAVAPVKKVAPVLSDDLTLDDMSKIIAGIKPKVSSQVKPIVEDEAWVSHKKRIDHTWKKYVTKRQELVAKWSTEFLSPVHKAKGMLFYPFSGPDILHAEFFFPHSDRIVMIGLEPAGSVLNFKKVLKKDFHRYLARIEKTVKHITQLSFFLTKYMAMQMFHKDVKRINGTLPTILFFLSRLGHTIISVERITLSPDGAIIHKAGRVIDHSDVPVMAGMGSMKIEKGMKAAMKAIMKAAMAPSPAPDAKPAGMKKKKRIRSTDDDRIFSTMKKAYEVIGNRVTFQRADGSKATLEYFSMNLCDEVVLGRNGLKKKPEIVNFLKKLPITTTYLKSASYLLHRPTFSIIRSAILDKTQFLLQDDSGFPIKHFTNDQWTNRFFGDYYQPIKMFAVRYQKDLKKIYKNKKNIGPLPFGIGYKTYKGRSNLMFSVRNKPASAAK